MAQLKPVEVGVAPAPGRRRRNRGSEVVHDRLIEAAISEFAARGFDGASTRVIAEKADAHQSQIKYHFDTKDGLWRRCIEQLLALLDAAIDEQPGIASRDPRTVMEAVIRGLVVFAAGRPELNRIMMHESTAPGARLSWLVDNHLASRRSQMIHRWEMLAEKGMAAPVSSDIFFHVLIGAVSLLYVNAPEAELMGIEPHAPDVVARHADGLIAMFLRSPA